MGRLESLKLDLKSGKYIKLQSQALGRQKSLKLDLKGGK